MILIHYLTFSHQSDCGPRENCVGNKCILKITECDRKGDCPPNKFCEANKCILVKVCKRHGDCKRGEFCRNGKCESSCDKAKVGLNSGALLTLSFS